MTSQNTGQRGSVGSVRFTSWNVRGLGGPIKRSRVFSHLKSLNTDIAFLQETHLCVNDHARLRKPWVGQVFHSNFNSKARGTAIIIHKRVQFSAEQTISDPGGRYIIVKGVLYQTPVILVNVYAPNFDNPNFMTSIFSSLPNMDTHRLIFGGDLNLVVDPQLDRSCPKRFTPSCMARALSTFMNQVGCIDPWRFLHPTKRDFSYFSLVHRVYSRIDYFFVDKALLSSVGLTEYSAIVISDHAPLVLELSLSPSPRCGPWRFNTGLLATKTFCEHISKQIDLFIDNNKSESTSPSLLWETFKAVMRGEIISYNAHSRKQKTKEQQDLVDAISKLDRQYSSSPTPELFAERRKLQSKFDLLSTGRAEYLLRRTRGTYYEYGDKASRLLASQLKHQSASQLITQVYDSSHSLTTNPTEINDAFTTFYSKLYTSEPPIDNTNIEHFFDSLDISNIDTHA